MRASGAKTNKKTIAIQLRLNSAGWIAIFIVQQDNRCEHARRHKPAGIGGMDQTSESTEIRTAARPMQFGGIDRRESAYGSA
jgi:hypothetical protein